MKVSLNMMKWFLDFELPSVEDAVTKIGAQLGAVEEVIDLGNKYQGVVIVKVVKCEPHSNADKLKVCMIDDGGVTSNVDRDSDNLVQVVCGAPNVSENILVAWLPPGSTVPSSFDNDPFVLDARELRGVVSNGMLASPKELALGDSHEGLLVIDQDYQPGADFATTLDLNDTIIDIENKMFTHRPDCFGFMGVAREIAGIYQKPFKGLDWYVTNPEFPNPETAELGLTFKNELPELVPRFTMLTLSNIAVGPSPLWLVDGLSRLGQKSINNIVDYTNWYMLQTGQPLHAYDYDKVKALSSDEATIVVRKPKKGEKIKLLNGKEIEPREEAIMIATDKQLIGIGGVMGGNETEVDEKTKNVILECANFNMYSIRRTSMTHGLFTDAVTRFTKGQSPLQNLAVLNRIIQEIVAPAIGKSSGKVAGKVIDDNHVDKGALGRNSLHPPVTITPDFINARLGLSLKSEQIVEILENVEFKVAQNGEELTVTAPFWRTDIEIPEDVVEEVGRLYGFDKLPMVLPKLDLSPAEKDPLLGAKSAIRDRLSKAGANELLTYSFVHGDLLKKSGQDPKKAFQISNALSPDLQYYRISLMPSLLEKVHLNGKAGYSEFALFEIGKTHCVDHGNDDEGLPREFEITSLVVTANNRLKKVGAPFYQARKYLESLIGVELEYKPVGEDMKDYPLLQPYDLKRSALVSVKGGEFLGIVGEFKSSVRTGLKLPNYTAGFEIDTEVVQKVLAQNSEYEALSRFPVVKQDITLKVPADLPYNQLQSFIAGELERQPIKNTTPTLEPVDIYQSEQDADHKNVTFRLSIASHERTLTDKEVNNLLDNIADKAKQELKAERI